MTKHGMLFSTMLGGIGLVTFGLGGALGCSTYWIGHGSLICGGVFVLLAPVGYLAGVAIFWLLRDADTGICPRNPTLMDPGSNIPNKKTGQLKTASQPAGHTVFC